MRSRIPGAGRDQYWTRKFPTNVIVWPAGVGFSGDLPPGYGGPPVPDDASFTPFPTFSSPCPPGFIQVGVLCLRPNGQAALVTTRLARTASHSARKRKSHRGTTVHYTLKGPAAVRFTVVKLSPGRLAAKGRCLLPKPKRLKLKKCTRQIEVPGSFTLESTAGANSFVFPGWIGGEKLKPGQYVLVDTPSLQGALGAPVRSKPFRITKR